MKTFSSDILIYGTVYVRAENEEQARELIAKRYGSRRSPSEFHLPNDVFEDEDPIMLSAVMTTYGVPEGFKPEENDGVDWSAYDQEKA